MNTHFTPESPVKSLSRKLALPSLPESATTSLENGVSSSSSTASSSYSSSHFGALSEPASDFLRHQTQREDSEHIRQTRNTDAAQARAYTLLTDNLSNSTFESYLCGNLSMGDVTQLVISANSQPTPVPIYAIPDCFYGNASTLFSFSASNVIFSGNDTIPDPFVRVGNAMDQINPTTFILLTSIFAPPPSESIGVNRTDYEIDWAATFAAFPTINYLQLAKIYLGPTASLPATIPATLYNFAVSCNLTGSIPGTLLSLIPESAVSFALDLSSNSLSGPIPGALLANLQLSQFRSLFLSLAGNKLEGSIPTLFTTPLSFMATLILDFSKNKLSGDPSSLFAPTATDCSTITTLNIILTQNQLSGPVPNWFTSNCSNMNSLIFQLGSNQFSGLLPFNLFSSFGFTSVLSTLDYQVHNNLISGPIPLLDIPTLPLSSCTIWLHGNQMTGIIPPDLFANLNWTEMASFKFDVSSNHFIGDIPSVSLNYAATPKLSTAQFLFANNPSMSGTVPPSFLASIGTAKIFNINAIPYITIDFSNTRLTGVLAIPDINMRPQQLSLNVSAANADFTSFGLINLNPKFLNYLDLSNNYRLTGDFPVWAPERLQRLNLANTAFSFCAGNRTSWDSFSLTSCILDGTDAYYCGYYYPPICVTSPPVPSSAPTGCPLSTRPSPAWTCVGSTWIYYGSFNGTTLTIPSGNPDSVVIGNVTSSTIVIGGIGSSLTLQAGCPTNLTTVTIELSPSEISQLTSGTPTLVLTSYGGSGCTNLSTVNLQTTIKGHSCKKVSVKKQGTENTLSALFSIDTSGCRTWWIILVSVLAVVLVIAVVVFILLAIFVPTVRNCIRPFAKRKATPGAV